MRAPNLRPTSNPAPHRQLIPAGIAVICAAAITACGAQSKPAIHGASQGPAVRYTECMRSHGEPGFPDPSATHGLVIPNDINTQSPAFKSAQKACGNLAQAGGQLEPAQSQRAELVRLAKCMRSHGVPNFGDPTSTPPPPSSGNVIGGNGTYLALGTARERQSPAYKRAATKCGARLP
jgi:hypothetical protein